MATWPIQFDQPMCLLGLLLAVPVIWLGRSSLGGLGRRRQVLAIVARVVVVWGLVLLLAEPYRVQRTEHVSVMAILDRSQSVPRSIQDKAIGYLRAAIKGRVGQDRFGLIHAAETPQIELLPTASDMAGGGDPDLLGDRTDLAASVRLAMAVLGDNTARRIVLLSDGNENVGALREAAKLARANDIALDVVPLRYSHQREVMVDRLLAPHNARVGQTVGLRCVLRATHRTTGRLVIEDNGVVLDLAPDSPELALAVALEPGLNVSAIHLPITTGGIHSFEARLMLDHSDDDTLNANNTASAVTFSAGHGHVLVIDGDGRSAREVVRVLLEAGVNAEYRPADALGHELLALMPFDAVIMVNTPNSLFSLNQQQMLVRYVHDIGGGLVMVGGPDALGAGGWIGSPVEDALPVSLDPPQRQQMPKGALALIMHSVEMPRGNYWGEVVAIAAAKSLSRLDLVGVIAYDWQKGGSAWVHPLGEAGDKREVIAAIKQMQMGDMPDFGSGMGLAFDTLSEAHAGQKHAIIISDGDPSPPSRQLLAQFKEAGITVSGVAVFPHSPGDMRSLRAIAQATGGRFYHVTNPQKLPQLFIKEAQTVRRPLVMEATFAPRVVDPLSELTKGVDLQPPALDGYVLTGAKQELVETIMVSPEGDPILASRQYGLGKTVVFTSDASSRWAGRWLEWRQFAPFWEQLARWSMRGGESPNLHIVTELEGHHATVRLEATGADMRFRNFLAVEAVAIGPDMQPIALTLAQVGPGRYEGQLPITRHGSYVINVRCKDGQEAHMARGVLVARFAPEFADLTDNAALLAEAAGIAGGRVLSGDPQVDQLFDHEGLVFPTTRHSLWMLLAMLWVALFLIDVAVRRVMIDPQTIRRAAGRLAAAVRGQAVPARTLDALRQRQVRTRRSTEDRRAQLARTRFEPSGEHGEAPDAPPPRAATPVSVSTEPSPQPPAPDEESLSTLERLKKAKAKARDTMQDDSHP